jgi:hypothetical protein
MWAQKHIYILKSTIFFDITPYSPLKVNRRFGGTYRLHLQSRRISRAKNQREIRCQAELASCSAYSSTMKMEAIFSSETSGDFQRTTRRYIPEDRALHNHRCENLKSYTCRSSCKASVILCHVSTWTGMWWYILLELPITKFIENTFSGSRGVSCVRTDARAERY